MKEMSDFLILVTIFALLITFITFTSVLQENNNKLFKEIKEILNKKEVKIEMIKEEKKEVKIIEEEDKEESLQGEISAEYHNARIKELKSRNNFHIQSLKVISSRLKASNENLKKSNEELEKIILDSEDQL